MFMLEKEICLFKHQFEKFVLDIYGTHYLDRISLELDGLMFRIKFMKKKNYDLHLIPELQKTFTTKALELRSIFGKILYQFITDIIGFGDTSFSPKDIHDVMAQDVKMDSMYVKFNIMLISENKEYLEYVDNKVDGGKAFNMFPDDFFRFYVDSYNDGIQKAFPEIFEQSSEGIGSGRDMDIFVHNFTFQTIDGGCNCNCTYCYMTNKTMMSMKFETAKKFIDELLQDNYGYINRYNSPAIIIEFIGGEPLLEIGLTREIYEYFLDQCYKLNHPWFNLHRISLCSNGLLYFDPEVQSFFNEYSSQISFNISIDGNKELHDACRIQPNGEGTYDICMAALNHFNKHHTPERNSKMTLAPDNMKYLFASVKNFIENGMHSINLNCIFEEGWNQETALLEYNELKKVADYVLENDLEHIYIAIFDERQEGVNSKENDGSFCGGAGSMLALRPNGQFYPCIRYMPSSVGDDVEDLCMGTVEEGMVGRDQDSEVLKKLDRVSRRGMENDICYNCPIGNSCANCVALNHQIYRTPNKKVMFICIQMISEALSNIYYWNLLNIKKPEYNLGVRKNNVPDEWALLVINQEELDFLKMIETRSMITTFEYRKDVK